MQRNLLPQQASLAAVSFRFLGDRDSGAPQGSVIGPLFIFLFVNDLPDAHKALMLLFVDDVKIVTRRTQNMNLYNYLTVAWDWSKKWDLPINPAKCNIFIIRLKVPVRFFL